jgi:release factor glutamine methyltransferase
VARLRAAGSVFAEEEAELLVSAAEDDADLASMVARRVGGEPVEAIVGWVSFCGLRIVVAPDVFVPRRRTELLVAVALRIVRHEMHRNPRTDGAFRDGLSDQVVVEMCCGTAGVVAAILEGLGTSAGRLEVMPPTSTRGPLRARGRTSAGGDRSTPVICTTPCRPTSADGSTCWLPTRRTSRPIRSR